MILFLAKLAQSLFILFIYLFYLFILFIYLIYSFYLFIYFIYLFIYLIYLFIYFILFYFLLKICSVQWYCCILIYVIVSLEINGWHSLMDLETSVQSRVE